MTTSAVSKQGEKPLCNTTYKASYQPEPTFYALPPIKFTQPPAFQLSNVSQLQPRFFPLIPCGPHRRLAVDRPPAPGLGTYDLDMDTFGQKTPKPIVRTLPPSEIINTVPQLNRRKMAPRNLKLHQLAGESEETLKPITKMLIKDICQDVAYTSISKLATEEAKIPFTRPEAPASTWELNADMVKQRPAKKGTAPELWQRAAGSWDAVQSRPRCDRPIHKTTRCLQPSKLLHRRQQRNNADEIQKRIKDLGQSNELPTSFIRQCPGYAGFVPRSPIEAPLCQKQSDEAMLSEMQGSYRAFPNPEYIEQRSNPNRHKGPMSRTVTLTYPYNPFNKLENDDSQSTWM